MDDRSLTDAYQALEDLRLCAGDDVTQVWVPSAMEQELVLETGSNRELTCNTSWPLLPHSDGDFDPTTNDFTSSPIVKADKWGKMFFDFRPCLLPS
jgi:hypothetical protein